MREVSYLADGECVELGDTKAEPAKSIMEEMDDMLKELDNELRLIDNAIYSPSNANSMRAVDDVKQDDCLLGTLNRQRYVAQGLLEMARHIREGLW